MMLISLLRFLRQALPVLLLPVFLSIVFFMMFSFTAVKGDSMLPVLHDGQRIFYSKIFYGLRINKYWVRWKKIQRDDLVVFRDGTSKKLLVKRCIAISGDPVHCDTQSLVIDDGSVFDLDPGMCEYFRNFSSVPDNFIFAVGDNLTESVDSRDIGFISADDVMGKVLYISSKQGNDDHK
ncbi:MAG: signal peptidase I [Spirochaetales bacterium]|nr:signal peptidase I [Spirochaetales bacterium]